jgi:hypothetical protein
MFHLSPGLHPLSPQAECRGAMYSARSNPAWLFSLTQETPEGSVFELTVGKAPEGRPHGRHHPPHHHPGGVDLYILHLYLAELVQVAGEI